ncbi:MAG: hypothetical protein ACMZI2_04890 [Candidatus Symbiodolus clandestinus]
MFRKIINWRYFTLNKPAKLGDADSYYNLSIAYEYGLGVAADPALAYQFHEKVIGAYINKFYY